MLPVDLKGEADWYMNCLMADPNLDSQTSIWFDYGRLSELCSVDRESIASPVSDLLSLAIRSLEAMGRSSSLRCT